LWAYVAPKSGRPRKKVPPTVEGGATAGGDA
jgi:hypothetical protein